MRFARDHHGVTGVNGLSGRKSCRKGQRGSEDKYDPAHIAVIVGYETQWVRWLPQSGGPFVQRRGFFRAITNRSQMPVEGVFTGFCVKLFGFGVGVGGFDYWLIVGYARIVTCYVHYLAAGAIGLEFPELVDGAVEDAVGVGAGSLDGAALFFGGFVEHGVDIGVIGQVGFGGVAAAEAPGGSGDFGGEGLFEDAFGAEFPVKGFAEFFVEVALFGADVVGSGVEPEGEGVAGRGGFAGFGVGAGGEVRILPVGVDLSVSGH